MSRPLLIDVTACCAEHTDAALEALHKAIGEGVPDIWDPHPNPYVRRIVELFTQRGLSRIEDVKAELLRFLRGEAFDAGLVRPDLPSEYMQRWSPSEVGLTKLYLESLPPEDFALSDWMLLVEYLAQRYLREDDLVRDADWLSYRAVAMGKVQAHLGGDVSLRQVDDILLLLPPAIEAAKLLALTPLQEAVLAFGRARCADQVTQISESVRHRMRCLLVDYQEGVFLENRRVVSESIQSRLLDEFATLNRDWRRIAVTEAGEMQNQGYIASLSAGTKVKRIEMYRGACPFCRSIDGMVLTVTDPAMPDKDPDKDVWVGKTNMGRSASPRRREGSELVERPKEERWWIPAGPAHPHCRGSWVKVTPGVPRDPVFDEWIASLKRRDVA